MLRRPTRMVPTLVALTLLLAACGGAPSVTAPSATPAPTVPASTVPSAAAPTAATTEPIDLWADATATTIGTTAEWTNKVELADINGDQRMDILFANGGLYETPGEPEPSRVFLNQGAVQPFTEVTTAVFGPQGMLARVIKVRDVTGDGHADILVGTTFQTQSRLYTGDGHGRFTDATAAAFPQQAASIGDLEVGDVDDDGDLDLVLADWGPGSPMDNRGGRILLWLNDGAGHFADATDTHMPGVLVRFSWDLELVDVDNDYDLDVLIACKQCTGSFLFENDGTGAFTDVSSGRLPQFGNNYEFAAMDLNADAYLDLVTINDGEERPLGLAEHVLLNDQHGAFRDATAELWPASDNPGYDDNVVAFLDYDSDGDADFLIGSLDGPDRLLINDGGGHLTLATKVITNQNSGSFTLGTLGLGVADLNGDGKLDLVHGEGEVTYEDAVFLGTQIAPDTAPPIISSVEPLGRSAPGAAVRVRARVHDNASAITPHDLHAVLVRWNANGETGAAPLAWYGEYLWHGTVDAPASGSLAYQVCATDVRGNEACAAHQPQR